MHLIREETGISPKTGLSVLQNGKLLVPGTKLHELRLEYGEIVFLSYTQSEVFWFSCGLWVFLKGDGEKSNKYMEKKFDKKEAD